MTTIAILGLGEAGSALARDLLDAGAVVRAYDPVLSGPTGVLACSGEADAVSGCDLVLSVNSAADAPIALENGIPGLGPSCVWADLNTAAAGLKQSLAAALDSASPSLQFADVALMSPVPGRGLATPMIVSGAGAVRYAELLAPLGASIEVLAGPAGEAATRKLLRSVFFKGLAAAVMEALTAARAAGLEQWLRDNISEELTRAGPETVDRLVEGSVQHARRRSHEMAAAAQLLQDLDVPAQIALATAQALAELADEAPPSQ